MRAKRIRLVAAAAALAAVAAVSVTGLASAKPNGKAATLQVAMLMPCPISDKGFCQNGYGGLLAVKQKYGAKIAFTEIVPLSDAANIMRRYARAGFNVIISHGNEYNDAAKQVSAEFPKVKFFNHAGEVSGPNLASSQPAFEQDAYLGGIAAARMSKTGTIGTITFLPLPQLHYSVGGLAQGARSVNPKMKIKNVYIQTLTDGSKAKEAATSLLAAGADVLVSLPDIAGAVVPRFVEGKKGAFSIGYPSDLTGLAPKTLLGSLVADFKKITLIEIASVVNGKFKGKVSRYGIKDGGVFFKPGRALPAKVRAEIAKASKEIAAGKIKVALRPKLTK